MGPVRAAGRPPAAQVTRLASAAPAALVLALGLLLILAGCDSQPDPTAPTTAKVARPAKASNAGGDPDMVAAFSATGGQPGLVDLKFKLDKRPGVGEPVDIEFAIIPTVELERLFARFQGADGLQILSGAETPHFDHPAMGVPVKHKITVTARSDGIYYVTAVVLADSDRESIARTFSVPLIAGQGVAESASAPAAASVAQPKRSTGQP